MGHPVTNIVKAGGQIYKREWMRGFSVNIDLCVMTVVGRCGQGGECKCLKSSGPRTEPCGTPCVRGALGDQKSPMETNCSLRVRYDLDQESIVPVMPKSVSRWVSSVSWQIVSKAEFTVGPAEGGY